MTNTAGNKTKIVPAPRNRAQPRSAPHGKRVNGELVIAEAGGKNEQLSADRTTKWLMSCFAKQVKRYRMPRNAQEMLIVTAMVIYLFYYI